MIMKHLDHLLTSSDPGDSLHHLHVIATSVGAVGPLGLPDDSKMEMQVYAIVPDDSHGKTIDLIAKTIAMAAVENEQRGNRVLFAGLSQETWTTPPDPESERLAREGRSFKEHSQVVEATIVYAACSDGRRYQSMRYLTGPDAGKKVGVEIFIGPVQRHEAFSLYMGPLLRKLVGLGF